MARKLGETASPRVRELEVRATALGFVRACAEHCAAELGQLRPLGTMETLTDEALASTPLYRRVRQLVEYAVRGQPLKEPLAQLVEPLRHFVVSPLWDRVDIEGVAASVDFQNGRPSAIETVLAAAFARARLDAGEELTTSELAVLGGVNRSSVIFSIKGGKLSAVSQGKRGTGGAYVVAASEARRWLAERSVAGVMEEPPPSPRSARRSRVT